MSANKIRQLIVSAGDCLRRATPEGARLEKGIWGRWKNPATINKFTIPFQDFHDLWSILDALTEEFKKLEKSHHTEIEELTEELEE